MAKFKIGEVAWALSKRHGKRKCVIVSECFFKSWRVRNATEPYYWIEVDSYPSGRKDGRWNIPEFALRKVGQAPHAR